MTEEQDWIKIAEAVSADELQRVPVERVETIDQEGSRLDVLAALDQEWLARDERELGGPGES